VKRKRISLALGLALTAIAVAAVVSRSPAVLARTNGVSVAAPIAEVSGAYQACQAHEELPRGTSAIRLSLEALLGPRVRLRVLRGRRELTGGEQAAGWSRQAVTIPVEALPQAATDVSVCFALTPKDETVRIKGVRARGRHGAAANSRIRIEYLRPGARSWWALAPSVLRRAAFGHATSGDWIVWAAIAGMLIVTAIVSYAVLREVA
jgi:hypothetical protein